MSEHHVTGTRYQQDLQTAGSEVSRLWICKAVPDADWNLSAQHRPITMSPFLISNSVEDGLMEDG
jgi:hypothetical protein